MSALDAIVELLVVNPLTQSCDWCEALPYDECTNVEASARNGVFRVHSEREDAAKSALRRALEAGRSQLQDRGGR